MAQTNNSSSAGDSFSLPSMSLGTGLLEISALTTLIGTGVPEHLVFGTRGVYGLAWAGSSAFGSIGAIKACISGASSGWLRETLGLRSKISDFAVGMDLDLTRGSYGSARVRRNFDLPLGFVCDSGETVSASHVKTKTSKHRSPRDVYAFDHSISTMLSGIPDAECDGPPRIFSYAEYDFFRTLPTPRQILAFAISMLKVLESFFLLLLGGGLLCIVTLLPWLYFFIVAVVVAIHDYSTAFTPEPLSGRLDIVAGRLPSLSDPPGPRKIILGASHNPRLSYKWRIMWAIGALVYASSLFITYFLLSQQSGQVLATWTGYQFMWLIARILIHHFADPVDPMAHRLLVEQPWADLSESMKERVVNLTAALSLYQTYFHPRGELAYKEDTVSSQGLKSHLTNATQQMHYPLPPTMIATDNVPVDIKAVVGDTMLSSAAWMTGSKLTPLDLYDSCILVFALPSVPPSPALTVAIPAARVLSVIPAFVRQRAADPEVVGVPRFIPKGATNMGSGLNWLYWVPFISPEGVHQWLHFRIDQETPVIGRHRAEVLTDAQISSTLAAGTLNIGLNHVDDVKAILDISRRSRDSLLQLLS